MERMFEIATREKMRFPFKGVISVEELWDLDVKSLDAIFKTLSSQLKESKEESLLDVKSKQDCELENKIEIIKYIVSVKLEESSQRALAKEKKEQKQKLLEILSEKENESLMNMSLEEIKKKIAELE